MGLSLDVAEVSAVSELDAAFRAISQRRPDAALVIADPFLAHERALLAKLMVEHRLPSISAYHECAVAGGLMAYMTSYYDIFRREATFIDKIFKCSPVGSEGSTSPFRRCRNALRALLTWSGPVWVDMGRSATYGAFRFVRTRSASMDGRAGASLSVVAAGRHGTATPLSLTPTGCLLPLPTVQPSLSA